MLNNVEPINKVTDMAGSLANVSILIVDDSPHLRRLIITMLRSFGAQVMYEAKNYQQAVEFIDRKPVDIALVDWMLGDPLGNGNDLINYIRSSMVDEVAFMPIIMITGHTEKENIEEKQVFEIGNCYTISEISAKFHADPGTVKNLIKRNKIPTKKVGSFVYVPKNLIDKIFDGK